MTGISRRDFVQLSATTALAAGAQPALAAPYTPMLPVEKGARLQLLRWTGFINTDDKLWKSNTAAFTRATGVPVAIQELTWTDVQPKSALAAQLGSGPDIIMGWYDDPFIYPEKLLDVSDVCEDLGKANGGWYPVAKTYGYDTTLKHWIAVPVGAPGAAVVYRESWVKEAGFDAIPKDFDNFLKLCRGLKKIGHPMGLALGHAVGDANTWCYWTLWGFGGKPVDAENKVAINSKETHAALAYAKALYETMIPGTSAWLDASNNQSFLAGKISLTVNGISIWFVAKQQFPKIFADTHNADMPIGPVGTPTVYNLFSQAFVFRYCRYPNAAKEYLRFMMSAPQVGPWVTAMTGYVTPALRGYAKLPIWNESPDITPYRDVLAGTHFDGWAGRPGKPAATALNNFVIVDMFADACVNGTSPKAAAATAEKRLKAIYS